MNTKSKSSLLSMLVKELQYIVNVYLTIWRLLPYCQNAHPFVDVCPYSPDCHINVCVSVFPGRRHLILSSWIYSSIMSPNPTITCSTDWAGQNDVLYLLLILYPPKPLFYVSISWSNLQTAWDAKSVSPEEPVVVASEPCSQRPVYLHPPRFRRLCSYAGKLVSPETQPHPQCHKN